MSLYCDYIDGNEDEIDEIVICQFLHIFNKVRKEKSDKDNATNTSKEGAEE